MTTRPTTRGLSFSASQVVNRRRRASVDTVVTLPTWDFVKGNPTANALISDTTGISGSGGLLVFDFNDDAFATAGATSPIIVCLSAGTSTTERVYPRKLNTGNRLSFVSQTGGVTDTLSNYNIAFPSGKNTGAISWGSGYLKFFINGMLCCYTTGSFTMPNIDSIYVGRLNSGTSNNYTKTVNNIRLVNTAQPDAVARLATQPTILSGITYDATKNIIMFMGQSNSSGVASGTASYTNTSKMFLLKNSLAAIEAYSDPYDSQTSSRMTALDDSTAAGSYAGYLIDALAGLTGKDIVACPANKSTTSFNGSVPSWRASSNNGTYLTSGTRFRGMGPSVAAAINTVQIAKQFAPVRAVCLSLGEQDIQDDTTEADYLQYCGEFIDEVRAATMQPDLPFVLMGFPAWNVGWADAQSDWDAINNAQKTLAATKAKVAKPAGTDIAGGLDSGLHYSLASNATIGPIGAAAVNALAF